MSDFITCPVCRGKKKVMGMGMIPHECKHCLGVGYVNEETVIPTRLHGEDEIGLTKLAVEDSLAEPSKIELTPKKTMTPPSLKRRADLKKLKAPRTKKAS